MKIWIRQTTDFVRVTTVRVEKACRAYNHAQALATVSILTGVAALIVVVAGTTMALDAIPSLGLNETAAQALTDDTVAWGNAVRALAAGSFGAALIGFLALAPIAKPLEEISDVTEPLRYLDPDTVVRVALPEGETP